MALTRLMRVCLFFGVCAGGFAQSALFTLRGKVTDPSGGFIEGARIEAGAPSIPPVYTTQTGEFSLELPTGTYLVRISKEKFLPFNKTVMVPSGADRVLEATLALAPVENAVQVTDHGSYAAPAVVSATKTLAPPRDIPQAITVVTREQIDDQLMLSMGDVVRYIPGITAIQGENNRDQLVIRGQSTSADFFLDGVRDDVQYFRDLYNVDRVEALKGPDAMIFGRGGGGGVVNRVTKEAGYTPLRQLTLQGGSFGAKRVAADFDQPLGAQLAFRLNAMYENSDSFRDFVNLRRYGITPALTVQPDDRTKLTFQYEDFHDQRVADRGIPSFLGAPIDTRASTYFGDPHASHVAALVHIGVFSLERQVGPVNLKNRTLAGDYDRSYQNFVPGAVSASGVQDSLSAYNNDTQRRNFFSQTDAIYSFHTGPVRHTLLGGLEIGRQLTNNLRNTGYFGGSSTTLSVPLADPVIHSPVIFRQSATDASNHLQVNLAAPYFQDQIALTRWLQLIGGVRFDYFDLQYYDRRSPTYLRRIDRIVSPRGGFVFKPATAVSVYGTYSVSSLPSSGDQFSSLTTITQQVKPEKFTNYEAGVKWDVFNNLSFTTAVYRLNRDNTRSTDPNDPTRIVQTGSQRTNGWELGLTGSITRKWKFAGGYSWQDAFVTSTTASARAGAQVAQVPHRTFSVWNHYSLTSRLAVGLGILNRSNMFAAIDDTVTLPGYTRFDAAVYYSFTERIRLQANIENLLDRTYYLNADSNTNISPGSPRAARVALVFRF